MDIKTSVNIPKYIDIFEHLKNFIPTLPYNKTRTSTGYHPIDVFGKEITKAFNIFDIDYYESKMFPYGQVRDEIERKVLNVITRFATFGFVIESNIYIPTAYRYNSSFTSPKPDETQEQRDIKIKKMFDNINTTLNYLQKCEDGFNTAKERAEYLLVLHHDMWLSKYGIIKDINKPLTDDNITPFMETSNNYSPNAMRVAFAEVYNNKNHQVAKSKSMLTKRDKQSKATSIAVYLYTTTGDVRDIEAKQLSNSDEYRKEFYKHYYNIKAPELSRHKETINAQW